MPFDKKKYYENYHKVNKDKYDKPHYCEICQISTKGHATRHNATKSHIKNFIIF